MNVPWDLLSQMENFFQLGFLFTGLEASSTVVLLTRIAVFLVVVVGLSWIVFRIVMKVLECLQAFLSSIGSLPRSFFLLLLLVVPLSSDSIGAKWIGYLMIVGGLITLALVALLALVLWRYGVDQALRFIDTFRGRNEAERESREESTPFPRYNSRSQEELVPKQAEFSPQNG